MSGEGQMGKAKWDRKAKWGKAKWDIAIALGRMGDLGRCLAQLPGLRQRATRCWARSGT